MQNRNVRKIAKTISKTFLATQIYKVGLLYNASKPPKSFKLLYCFYKSSAKTIELKKPRVQGFSVAVLLFSDIMATDYTFDVILTKIGNVFIIWSTLAGYEELTGE